MTVLAQAPSPVVCIFSNAVSERGQPMDEKEVYQKKIEARIDQLSAKITELKAKLEGKQAESKAEYYERIEDLKKRRDKAFNHLEDLKQSGSEAWQTIKAGLDNAVRDLQDAFDKAASKFK